MLASQLCVRLNGSLAHVSCVEDSCRFRFDHDNTRRLYLDLSPKANGRETFMLGECHLLFHDLVRMDYVLQRLLQLLAIIIRLGSLLPVSPDDDLNPTTPRATARCTMLTLGAPFSAFPVGIQQLSVSDISALVKVGHCSSLLILSHVLGSELNLTPLAFT